MVTEAVTKALSDADITIDDIDAVVFGQGPDAFTGVENGEKWCSAAAGALHKPVMRVHTGGATGAGAAVCGFMHVASGMFETVLVVSYERIKESENAQYILNTIWDPIYERNLELNTITIIGIFATSYMEQYGTTLEHLSMIAVKNRANAAKNPYAHLQQPLTMEDAMKSPVLSWPLRLCDCCPSSDGACAIVVASEDKVKTMAGPSAWIRGVSQIADTVFVGDRLQRGNELRLMESLDLAARRAYQIAGIGDPRHEIDVAEIYNPFTIIEIMAYERLGFCKSGEGGKFIEKGIPMMNGGLPVNPSGGTLCSNPISATALYRVADAANQVRGKAGPIQVPDVRNALAHGIGGSGQFNTVIVLGKDPY